MKLDTELVDVTGDFSALRFVLFELMLYVGDLDRVSCGSFEGRIRNGRRLAALLAIQRQAAAAASTTNEAEQCVQAKMMSLLAS